MSSGSLSGSVLVVDEPATVNVCVSEPPERMVRAFSAAPPFHPWVSGPLPDAPDGGDVANVRAAVSGRRTAAKDPATARVENGCMIRPPSKRAPAATP